MPKIRPFCGIRPNPDYAGEVVLDVENLNLQTAKIIQQRNPYSYVNMLVPKLDNLFLRGSKNELAFKKINENFDDFLDKGVLIRDEKESLYIYRVSRYGQNQTGIWALTSVDDYLENRVKKHELTRPEREAVLIDYLQQTGIDANPVLITYEGITAVYDIILKTCERRPDLSFSKDHTLHELWKIDGSTELQALVSAFNKLPAAYIADGHHRAAAAAKLALKQRTLSKTPKGGDRYNFFTTVYMAADQLRIYPFHRLVKDINGHTTSSVLDQLRKNFLMESSVDVVEPANLHEFGMYLDGNWYRLKALPHTYNAGDAVAELDVTILQEYVLRSIFNIQDPRTDPRLNFSGGILPLENLIDQIDVNDYAVLFTLFPTSLDQLIKVADSGEVMPPKSTWFEPKFQAGMLINKIS